MKPSALIVGVLATLVFGSFAYQKQVGLSRQEEFRDVLKDTDFNPNVKTALNSGSGDAVLPVPGKPLETKLKVMNPPSSDLVLKAAADLQKAEAVAAERGRSNSAFLALIKGAREALEDKEVVRSFGAQVYCGRTKQFKQGDEEDGASSDCRFEESGSICYRGDIGQARDLIVTATNQLGYWDGDDENNVRAWIHDGKLMLYIANEGSKMAQMEVRPCN